MTEENKHKKNIWETTVILVLKRFKLSVDYALGDNN